LNFQGKAVLKDMIIPLGQLPEILVKNKIIKLRSDIFVQTALSKKMMLLSNLKLILKFE
jgi:hypothetical protein